VSTWTYTLSEKGEVSFKRFDWWKSGGGVKPDSRGPSSRQVSTGGGASEPAATAASADAAPAAQSAAAQEVSGDSSQMPVGTAVPTSGATSVLSAGNTGTTGIGKEGGAPASYDDLGVRDEVGDEAEAESAGDAAPGAITGPAESD
jgi:hypothetical protein